MPHVSVASLIDESVRSPRIARRTVWGSGVQSSELVRAGRRMFVARWRDRGEPRLRRLADPLSPRQRAVAEDILRTLGPELECIADASAQLVDAVRGLSREQGVPVSLDAISGRCTSAASRLVASGGALPDAAAITRIAQDILDAVPRLSPLTAATFVAEYRATYDAAWAARGAANLAAYPPSSVLLGPDRRPALAHPPGTRETDLLGTARSVHSRYCSYRPAGPRAKVPFRSRAPRCVQPITLKPTDRDVGTEEVYRACAPYGLSERRHRAALRGICFGVTDNTSVTDDPLLLAAPEPLPDDCLTLEAAHSEAIAATVERLVHDRLRLSRDRSAHTAQTAHTVRTAPSARAGRQGQTPLDVTDLHWAVDGTDRVHLATVMERVAIVVIRRAWKALRGLELLVAETACSCSLVKSVKSSLDRAVPTALAQWRDATVQPGDQQPNEAGRGDTPAIPQNLVDLLMRQNATGVLLAAHGGAAAPVLLLQPGWRDTYAAWTRGDHASYLDPDEFADWCRDLVPHAAGREEEAR